MMSEARHPSSVGRTWVAVAAGFVVFLALYVLSIGPAKVAAMHWSARPGNDDVTAWEVLHTVYFPLLWTCDVTGTTHVLKAYVDLWQ